MKPIFEFSIRFGNERTINADERRSNRAEISRFLPAGERPITAGRWQRQTLPSSVLRPIAASLKKIITEERVNNDGRAAASRAPLEITAGEKINKTKTKSIENPSVSGIVVAVTMERNEPANGSDEMHARRKEIAARQ